MVVARGQVRRVITPSSIDFLDSSRSKLTVNYESLRSARDLVSLDDKIVICLFDASFLDWVNSLSFSDQTVLHSGNFGGKDLVYTLCINGVLVTLKADHYNVARPESKESKKRNISKVNSFSIYTNDGPKGTNQYGDKESAEDLLSNYKYYESTNEIDNIREKAKRRLEAEISTKLYRPQNLPRQIRRYFKL